MRTGYFAGKLLLHGLLPVGKALKFNGLGGGFGAKLLGAGTSASPAVMATAATNAIQFYIRSTGTGAVRAMYLRHYMAGGGSGETLRAFTTITADASTAHGAHISLNFDLTKKLSGLGVASRNTLHIPNDTSSTGTLAATQSEVFLDGTSSNPSGALVGLQRYDVSGGDATARARIKLLWILSNTPTGSGNMLETGLTAANLNAGCTKALRISIDGVVHWIPVSTTLT